MHRCLLHLVLFLLCTGLTGCTVCKNAARTVWVEPRLFHWKRDAKASHELYLSWARQAWLEYGADSAPCTSESYAWGFRVGFADYVFAGDRALPPAVPPRQFWNVRWRTDRGKQAVDEWFAGYRHGMEVARAGGYREQAVVRTSFATDGYLHGNASGVAGYSAGGLGRDELFQPSLTAPEIIDAAPTEAVPAPPSDRSDLPVEPMPEDLPLLNTLPRPVPASVASAAVNGVSAGPKFGAPAPQQRSLNNQLRPSAPRGRSEIHDSQQPEAKVPPNPFLAQQP